MDDYSDLTDIDSGDDYQRTQTEAKKNAAVYAIRNTLKAPRATTYSSQALYEQIHNGDINLDADYQRDVVWQDTKQIGLVDSIYRNFYVPPIIFATKSHEDGSETKICIDGKQRLTSIRRFMDGLIPHKDPQTSEKWWYKDIPGSRKGRKLLPERLRRMFSNKQIVCVEYQDITEDDEREIFQRVQLGMALTPAEKLQVINTPRSQFVRSLIFTHITEGGLSPRSLEWDSSRGADFRCVASSLWCLDKWVDGHIKAAPTIQQLEKWLSEEDNLNVSFSAKCTETFQIYDQLVLDKKLGKVFKTNFSGPDSTKDKTKVAPLEFVLIPLLIAVNKDKLTLQQLSVAIGKMREDVRKQHVDIRLNNKVAKTMVEFIRGFKAPKGNADSGPSASASVNIPGSGPKRKRVVAGTDSENSEEDGDSRSDFGDNTNNNNKKTSKKKQKPLPKIKKIADQLEPSLSFPPPQTNLSLAPTPLPSNNTSRMAALRAARMAAPPPPSAVRSSYPTYNQSQQQYNANSHVGTSSSTMAQLPTPPSPGATTPGGHRVQQSQMQHNTGGGGPGGGGGGGGVASSSSSSSYYPPPGGFSSMYSDMKANGGNHYSGSSSNGLPLGYGGGSGNTSYERRSSYQNRISDNGYNGVGGGGGGGGYGGVGGGGYR